MKSRASKIVLAAVLASSIPATALACEHDREHDWHGDHRPPAAYVPPPAYAPPPAPAGYRWRELEIARLSAEIQALDARRAEAHARFGWNPRRMWRFERWYEARHAELEWRLHELQYVAWR